MTNAIEIENLSYSYRSDWLLKQVPRLSNISLNVAAGEAFGFLGHNGAGKTTAIKCLLNLLRPTKGSIKIFGQDSLATASRNNVGYLPEQPYFYDHLTVMEILEMYATLSGVRHDLVSEYSSAALELVSLSKRQKSPMRSLSKGLTQRVALAQAIVARPRLLVLDEPFSGLDPLGRKEFADIFRELKSQGVTLFMSSHILQDVESLCERASILINGELRGIYRMSELGSIMHGHFELALRADNLDPALFASASTKTVQGKSLQLTYDKAEDAQQALKLAIEKAYQIESYQFIHAGLEGLFVKLMQQEKEGRGAR